MLHSGFVVTSCDLYNKKNAETQSETSDCSISNSQDGFPIRIKAVNIINEPRIFKGIFAIIKPFLKEKMAERVSVLSSSSQRCCEHFSQT